MSDYIAIGARLVTNGGTLDFMTGIESVPRPNSRTLGIQGPAVTSPGLGCMSLSGGYGPTDDDESIAVIHSYIDGGGTLIDTGDFYGAGHNETLIARALRERSREDVVLSVKFGTLLSPDGMITTVDTRPDTIRNSLAYSLQRFGTDHIDIYRPARLDPNVPIEETVGAIQELVDAGYVRHIGLSEVGVETIRRAASVAPISDLQIEYSLLSREIEQSGILAACRELGIGITAYGVLAKGLVAGSTGGIRAMFPRYQGENLEHNQALLAQLTDISETKGVSLPQLAVAWVAAQGEDIVPIVGARRVEQIESTLASNAVTLSDEELSAIEAAVPAGSALGDRYPAAFMALLDSES